MPENHLYVHLKDKIDYVCLLKKKVKGLDLRLTSFSICKMLKIAMNFAQVAKTLI